MMAKGKVRENGKSEEEQGRSWGYTVGGGAKGLHAVHGCTFTMLLLFSH